MLGQAIPRAEHHVLAVVKLVGRLEFLSRDSDFCEWHSPILRADPPARGVFNSKWVGMAASLETTILAIGNLPQTDDPVIKNELLELASVCEEVARNIEDHLTGG